MRCTNNATSFSELSNFKDLFHNWAFSKKDWRCHPDPLTLKTFSLLLSPWLISLNGIEPSTFDIYLFTGSVVNNLHWKTRKSSQKETIIKVSSFIENICLCLIDLQVFSRWLCLFTFISKHGGSSYLHDIDLALIIHKGNECTRIHSWKWNVQCFKVYLVAKYSQVLSHSYNFDWKAFVVQLKGCQKSNTNKFRDASSCHFANMTLIYQRYWFEIICQPVSGDFSAVRSRLRAAYTS